MPPAAPSNPSLELSKFNDTCNALRDLLQRLVALKKEGADAEQLRKASTESSLLLLELKSTNRATHLAAHTARSDVQEQKLAMETTHLLVGVIVLHLLLHSRRVLQRCHLHLIHPQPCTASHLLQKGLS